MVYSIQIHSSSLILIYNCQMLSFERCTLKIVVPKFLKSSVGLQLTTLLENKFLPNYFPRFFPTFKEHHLKERGCLGVWAMSRFFSLEAPTPPDTRYVPWKLPFLTFKREIAGSFNVILEKLQWKSLFVVNLQT